MVSGIEPANQIGKDVAPESLNSDSEGVEYFPVDRPWVEADERVLLQGGQCSRCGTRFFPKKEVCHACGCIGEVESATLAQSGALYAFSVVHVAPRGFATPYFVGYVDLDDGVRIFGQIDVDGQQPDIGERLEFHTGRIRTKANGVPVLSYRFRRPIA